MVFDIYRLVDDRSSCVVRDQVGDTHEEALLASIARDEHYVSERPFAEYLYNGGDRIVVIQTGRPVNDAVRVFTLSERPARISIQKGI